MVYDTRSVCRRIVALADRDPRRAVTLARHNIARCASVQSLDYAYSAYSCGWALLRWERFDQARPFFQAAQAIFEAHDQAVDVLQCEYALLFADFFQYASPELEQRSESLAEQYTAIGATPDATRIRIYQAALLNILGRPRDALAVLERIRSLLAPGTIDLARWQYVSGMVAISLGEYGQANILLNQAEQAMAHYRFPIEQAKCRFQLAWLALRQEKLELALSYYRDAERIFARFTLPFWLALSNKAMGLLFTRQGAYDHALRVLLKALNEFTTLRRTGEIAACNLNLGNIYFYIGLRDAALAWYMRAETLYDKAGIIGERIIARRNRAMVYRMLGQLEQAGSLLLDVVVQAQASGDPAEVAETWNEIARVMAEDGQPAQAHEYFQQAHTLFTQLGNLLGAAVCQIDQGWMELQHGNLHVAEQLFQAATAFVREHPYDRWRTEYGLGRCAEQRGDQIIALAHYSHACTIVAGLRHRLASEAVSSSLFLQAIQLYTDSLRLAARTGALSELLILNEQQRALVLQRALALQAATPAVEYHDQLEILRHRISTLIAQQQTTDTMPSGEIDALLAEYSDLLLRAYHSAPVAEQTSGMPEASFEHVAAG